MSIKQAEELIAKKMGVYLEVVAPYKINLFFAFKAIIKIESDFQADDVMDEKNVNDFSIGYSQVRIDTARWVMNWWLDSRDKIKQKLFDPELNIECGMKYFVRQIVRYKGNMRLAVASYNSGSAKFKKDKPGVLINEDYYTKWKQWYDFYLISGEYIIKETCPTCGQEIKEK